MTTVRSDERAAAARRWIGANARALATTDPADDLTDLEPLASMASGAVIVGIGESTRAGREVTALGHRVLRLLAENLGFRVLAIQDDETVVERLDAYVRTGEGDPREALAELWVPWRTREMLAVLEWARSFNRRHPSDPFRMIGLNPPEARPSHYRAVLDHVAGAGGHRLDELRRHYDTIVTAHEVPEHVQRARGTHPGRLFADHARDALDLVASLPHADAVLDEARLILDFHSGGFAAGGFDYAATRRRSVAAMTSLLGDGTKIAYWEGMAFTANAPRLEPPALLEPFQTVGNELRRRLGAGYFSLLIGFGHGDVSGLHPGQRVPAPMAGSADAELSAAGPGLFLLDMHAPRPDAVDGWLRGPRELRGIGGIYDAAADADHYLTTGRLDEWFDALLHVRAITPTALLQREHPLIRRDS